MAETAAELFTPEIINDALTYEEYREHIDELLEEDRVTGEKQSEGLVKYTKMNVHRMTRLDKRTELNDELKHELHDLDSKMIWLVLTEGWCGDAAQNVPVLNKMAEESPEIELRFILRHQHEDIMDEYETNGARSIPKLIVLDAENLEELGSWGPRPDEAQRLVYKEWIDNYPRKEWAEKLHKWYADSNTQHLQEEFTGMIPEWASQTKR